MISPVRTWSLKHPSQSEAVLVTAFTRGAARWKCFQWYRSAYSGAKFGDFLRLTTMLPVANPLGVGLRIRLRTGTMGWTLLGPQGRVLDTTVYYVPDGGRHVQVSHASDVSFVNEEEMVS